MPPTTLQSQWKISHFLKRSWSGDPRTTYSKVQEQEDLWRRLMGFFTVSPNISGLKWLQLSVNTHGSLWSFTDLYRLLWPQKGRFRECAGSFLTWKSQIYVGSPWKAQSVWCWIYTNPVFKVVWMHKHRALISSLLLPRWFSLILLSIKTDVFAPEWTHQSPAPQWAEWAQCRGPKLLSMKRLSPGCSLG